MAGQLLGKNAVAYYNSATFVTPTWVPMSTISKLKWSLKWGRAANATRGSVLMRGGKTTGEAPISFNIEQDLTNAVFIAIWAAIISPTAVLDMLILNAASTVNGARGIRGEFDLSVDDDQDIGNVLTYEVEGQPAATANAFQTAVVAAGAPVFTTLAA